MFKKIVLTLSALALTTTIYAGRCDSSDVYFQNGVYSCFLQETLTNLEGQTFGIVQQVQFRLDIKLDSGKIPEYLRENAIIMPPQKLKLNVTTSGTPIVLDTEVSVSIGFDSDKVCIPKGNSGTALNIRILSGNLPSWVLGALEREANKNLNSPENLESFCSQANELLVYLR